ncbi:UDP-glucose 4-epimerase [Neomoorella thermoacetica]|uniref:UDP-glucose 4-epimerase n=1 Tax=Neomoorella thermoacetica TaxID=1525 RepID=UPI0000541BAF|nr:UDP-glucose 4-epimerase [Moorella thermoacetica]
MANAHILALHALEHGLQSSVFNVGTGKGYSVMEIIRKSEAVTGHTLPLEYKERRAGDPPVLVADSALIKRVLGWEPRYSDLETILSSAWRWHSTHPDGYR